MRNGPCLLLIASASPPFVSRVKHNHALAPCFTQAHLFSLPQLSLFRASDLHSRLRGGREAAAPPPGCCCTSSCHELLHGASGGLLQGDAGPARRRVKALQLALDLQAQLGSGPSPAGSWTTPAKAAPPRPHPGLTHSLMGHQTKVSVQPGQVIYYKVIHARL